MVRTILYMIVSIFVIALIRGIVGIITKGVGQLFEEESQQNAAGRRAARRPAGGFGGELVRCAQCGIYSSPAAGAKKLVQGQTLLFCSPTCRDKHAG